MHFFQHRYVDFSDVERKENDISQPCFWCSTQPSHRNWLNWVMTQLQASRVYINIIINGVMANSWTITSATGLTHTHCHCHSTVLITPCWGQFNWANPIRAQEHFGLLSSAVLVIEADGRKIKNAAAESCFAYSTFPDMLFALAQMNYGENHTAAV